MLGDEIGKGAYGRVYKGLDLENGDFVAIKQVSLENIVQEDLNTIMVCYFPYIYLPYLFLTTAMLTNPGFYMWMILVLLG
jgi:serine/threonine protein kinase